jgi:calcyphosin
MNRVKDQLAKRGAHTIRGIGRVFRQLDSYDGNKKVDKEEFRWGLKDIGVELTAYESGVTYNPSSATLIIIGVT